MQNTCHFTSGIQQNNKSETLEELESVIEIILISHILTFQLQFNSEFL